MTTDDPTFHIDVDYDVVEHDRQWAACRHCGAQWAIHKSNLGDDFDLITAGDNSCLDAHADDCPRVAS